MITEKRTEYFDFCLFCCHPPQTLKILENFNFKSRNLLSKFKFQKNIAVLHFDESVLPGKKIAWSAWNYLSTKSSSGEDAVSVSYLINKFQPIPVRKPVIVTLNPVTKIDSKKFPSVNILKYLPNKISLYETVIVSSNDELVDLFLKKINFFLKRTSELEG